MLFSNLFDLLIGLRRPLPSDGAPHARGGQSVGKTVRRSVNELYPTTHRDALHYVSPWSLAVVLPC